MPSDPALSYSADVCRFRYPARWVDFYELATTGADEDLKRFVELQEFRDRALEDHLERRPCGECLVGSYSLRNVQSIPNATWTTVHWDNADTNCGYSLNSYQIGTLYGGDYTISGHVQWAENTTGVRSVRVRRTDVNSSMAVVVAGDSRSAPSSVAVPHYQPIGARPISLNLGDLLTVEVYQSSGAALNLNSAVPSNGNDYVTNFGINGKCDCGTPIAIAGGG